MTPQIPMLTEYGELVKAYEQAERILNLETPNDGSLKEIYNQLTEENPTTGAIKLLQTEKGADLENLLEQIKPKKNVLVFSSYPDEGYPKKERGIFILDYDLSIHRITSTKYVIHTLCSHGKKLYHTEYPNSTGPEYNIIETLTKKIIAKRDNKIEAFCSHNKKLYDGNKNGKIFETLTGKNIAKRNEPIRTLYSYEGKLYDVTYYDIHETLSGKLIVKRKNMINAVCLHKGKLYEARNREIYDASIKKPIAKRDDYIREICSSEGILYDNTCHKIHNALTGQIIFKTESNLDSVISHPRKYFVEAGILK